MDSKLCILQGSAARKEGIEEKSAESMTNRSFGRFFCCNNKDNGRGSVLHNHAWYRRGNPYRIPLSPGGGAIRAESGIILNLCSSPQKDTHDTNINKY